MRPGKITGNYAVLTGPQFKDILAWKRKLGLTDLFFEPANPDTVSFSAWQTLLKAYIGPYRHLHLGRAPGNCLAELAIQEDRRVAEGDLTGIRPLIRGQLIRSGIYRTAIAEHSLDPQRVSHVLSMTDLAVRLAQAHQVDPDRAAVAGLFHDCTKSWAHSQSRCWMAAHYPSALWRSPQVYHQYTGAHYLEAELGYRDPEVLRAIRHHVDGDDSRPLSLIIYLADKLDPSRGYDSSAMISLALQDLRAAANKERQLQLAYLKAEGAVV